MQPALTAKQKRATIQAELIDLTSDEQQYVEYVSDLDDNDSTMSVDDQPVPDSGAVDHCQRWSVCTSCAS